MRHFVASLSLFALSLLAFPVLANVGTTSAGVTSTDPTNPSTDVQQQSAGFVAQNQQLQNPSSGIVLPGTVTGAVANGAAAGGAKSEDAKNGAAAAQTPAAPVTPPPPPPTYVSNIRPLNPAAESAAPEPAAKPETPSAPAAIAPTKPAVPALQRRPLQAPQIAVTPKPKPVVAPVREAPALAADPGGGRGTAPDGYTFYFGLAIAAALLALAFATFLRIGRNQAPR